MTCFYALEILPNVFCPKSLLFYCFITFAWRVYSFLTSFSYIFWIYLIICLIFRDFTIFNREFIVLLLFNNSNAFLVCRNIYISYCYFNRTFKDFAILFLRLFCVCLWIDFVFFLFRCSCIFMVFISCFCVHSSLWLRFCLFLSVLETKTQYWSVIPIWFSYSCVYLDCLRTFMDFGCCQPGILSYLFCVDFTHVILCISFLILFGVIFGDLFD